MISAIKHEAARRKEDEEKFPQNVPSTSVDDKKRFGGVSLEQYMTIVRFLIGGSIPWCPTDEERQRFLNSNFRWRGDYITNNGKIILLWAETKNLLRDIHLEMEHGRVSAMRKLVQQHFTYLEGNGSLDEDVTRIFEECPTCSSNGSAPSEDSETADNLKLSLKYVDDKTRRFDIKVVSCADDGPIKPYGGLPPSEYNEIVLFLKTKARPSFDKPDHSWDFKIHEKTFSLEEQGLLLCKGRYVLQDCESEEILREIHVKAGHPKAARIRSICNTLTYAGSKNYFTEDLCRVADECEECLNGFPTYNKEPVRWRGISSVRKATCGTKRLEVSILGVDVQEIPKPCTYNLRNKDMPSSYGQSPSFGNALNWEKYGKPEKHRSSETPSVASLPEINIPGTMRVENAETSSKKQCPKQTFGGLPASEYKEIVSYLKTGDSPDWFDDAYFSWNFRKQEHLFTLDEQGLLMKNERYVLQDWESERVLKRIHCDSGHPRITQLQSLCKTFTYAGSKSAFSRDVDRVVNECYECRCKYPPMIPSRSLRWKDINCIVKPSNDDGIEVTIGGIDPKEMKIHKDWLRNKDNNSTPRFKRKLDTEERTTPHYDAEEPEAGVSSGKQPRGPRSSESIEENSELSNEKRNESVASSTATDVSIREAREQTVEMRSEELKKEDQIKAKTSSSSIECITLDDEDDDDNQKHKDYPEDNVNVNDDSDSEVRSEIVIRSEDDDPVIRKCEVEDQQVERVSQEVRENTFVQHQVNFVSTPYGHIQCAAGYMPCQPSYSIHRKIGEDGNGVLIIQAFMVRQRNFVSNLSTGFPDIGNDSDCYIMTDYGQITVPQGFRCLNFGTMENQEADSLTVEIRLQLQKLQQSRFMNV